MGGSSKHARWQTLILLRCLQAAAAPDRVCYGAVMQSLVKSGLLAHAAQLLLMMPQKGLWPDAQLIADVLSCINITTVSTSAAIGTLLQVHFHQNFNLPRLIRIWAHILNLKSNF